MAFTRSSIACTPKACWLGFVAALVVGQHEVIYAADARNRVLEAHGDA